MRCPSLILSIPGQLLQQHFFLISDPQNQDEGVNKAGIVAQNEPNAASTDRHP
jgi:hypothetical protein